MLQQKILAATLVGLSIFGVNAIASAAEPGIYAGVQAGYGRLNYTAQDLANFFTPVASNVNSTNDSTAGIAGRLFAGYQFNEYFATEFGFTKFSDASFNNITGTISGYNLNSSGKIQQSAIDLVGKGILPLGSDFNAYGKLGVAFVMAKADSSGTVNILSPQPFSSSDSERKLFPTFGAGVSYDITSHVPISLGWDRIQKIGSNSLIHSSDFVSLGVAYNFGEL